MREAYQRTLIRVSEMEYNISELPSHEYSPRRRTISEMMYAKLPQELRDMVYSYILPIREVVVGNTPAGTMLLVHYRQIGRREIHTDSDYYTIWGPFRPDEKVFGDAVANEVSKYFYRTVRFKSARDYEDDGISIKNAIHSPSFPHPLFHVGVFVAYAIAQKGPYDQEEAVNALSALFCLKKGTKIRITMNRRWMMELSDVHEWEVESMFELMSPLLDRLRGAGYLVDLMFETDVPFVFNPTVTKLTVASLKKRAADVSTITNNTHLRARIKLLT
jgi:hypothetical protein